MTTLHLRDERDTLKMLRETICLAQTAIGVTYPSENRDTHLARLGRTVVEIDRQRPLEDDGAASPVSEHDRLVVADFTEALRAIPEPYSSNAGARAIWGEGYMAGKAAARS